MHGQPSRELRAHHQPSHPPSREPSINFSLPDFTLLSRFAARAGLVILRQTFVRRCHGGKLPPAGRDARRADPRSSNHAANTIANHIDRAISRRELRHVAVWERAEVWPPASYQGFQINPSAALLGRDGGGPL